MEENFSKIICPVCMSINLVPTGQVRVDEVCRSCQSPLFDDDPVTLTSASFEHHASVSDLPLFANFWSSEYDSMMPLLFKFGEVAGQLEPEFRLGWLDIETEPAIAERYRIRSIPTYMVILHGRVLSSRTGVMLPRDLIEWPRAVMSEWKANPW